jgi:dGTPase
MGKFEPADLRGLRFSLDRRESDLFSPRAASSADGLRRQTEERLTADYRQSFAVDADRILNSLAYTRYIDKTQVFYLIKNDHITHRVLHVQLVSKAARTIGRYLGLNEDLIEAIALGHDIGHTPFGHDGEKILSDLCRENGIGYFQHNVQSVQFLDRVERKGKGWNLCLQTMDGILSHDGEVHDRMLLPERGKTFDRLEAETILKKRDPAKTLTPMTLEGCVVRMSDTISYVGRDIEDAIRLGLIVRSDLPAACAKRLGRTNGTMVYSLVTDVIQNSYGRDYVAFSPEVSEVLKTLKAFNMERIYMNPAVKEHLQTIRDLFRCLFGRYLSDLEQDNRPSVIFRNFLENMSPVYTERHSPAEIVRDFIAGMTDRYFLGQCPPELRPDYRRMQAERPPTASAVALHRTSL